MAVSLSVKGIAAAVFSPFDSAGELNLSVIPKYAAFLSSNGVSHVFVNGTTGESLSLTQQERMRAAEAWAAAKQQAGVKTLMIHVGAESLKDSIELARHAAGLPAVDAIGLMPPSFFRPPDIPSLVEYCRQVAGAAPNVPFYYYHIPSMTGVNFNMSEFMKAARAEIASLVGIKFSQTDLLVAAGIQSEGFNVLWGRDQEFLGAMAHGIDGVIGSTYNYLGAVNASILPALEAGDLQKARAQQHVANSVLDITLSYGKSELASQKAVLGLVGVELGPPRCPLPSLTQDEVRHMRDRLQHAGFFSLVTNV